MRVAILYSVWNGFNNAQVRALKEQGAEILRCRRPSMTETPYDESRFEPVAQDIVLGRQTDDEVVRRVKAFRPERLFMSGWGIPLYRRIARDLAGVCPRIMGSDAQWKGTLRQHVASLISPFYIRPLSDHFMTPGPRQSTFARRLGFDAAHIHQAGLPCDMDLFTRAWAERRSQGKRRAFLFTGRLVEVKGLDVLLPAYAHYRAHCGGDPWPLLVAGTGPLAPMLENQPGVEALGFMQPEDLATVFAECSAFVLPSISEAHGVVVHEAAAAGCGIICSDRVGAGDLFVEDGVNGRVVAAESVQALADALLWYASQADTRLEEIPAHSQRLSQKRTPEKWADTIMSLS